MLASIWFEAGSCEARKLPLAVIVGQSWPLRDGEVPLGLAQAVELREDVGPRAVPSKVRFQLRRRREFLRLLQFEIGRGDADEKGDRLLRGVERAALRFVGHLRVGEVGLRLEQFRGARTAQLDAVAQVIDAGLQRIDQIGLDGHVALELKHIVEGLRDVLIDGLIITREGLTLRSDDGGTRADRIPVLTAVEERVGHVYVRLRRVVAGALDGRIAQDAEPAVGRIPEMEKLLLIVDGEGGPERRDRLAQLRAGDFNVLHADLERVVAHRRELETGLEIERVGIARVLLDGRNGGEFRVAGFDREWDRAHVGQNRRGIGHAGRARGGSRFGGGGRRGGGDNVGGRRQVRIGGRRVCGLAARGQQR